MPLISILLLTMPLGVALIWWLPRRVPAAFVAAVTCISAFVVAILILSSFDAEMAGFQLIEEAAWLPGLNINYLVGVDGISVLFLPVTALLSLGAVVMSYRNITRFPRIYYSLLLVECGATLGVFCALDTVMFFLFWEISIIPIYFLVSLWGNGERRRLVAKKYMLIMIAGGLPILFGFLLLAQYVSSLGLSSLASPFDLRVLLATPLPESLQLSVFLLLLVGFGVKAPILPLHTWFPLVAADGPAAITALLAGLKLGVHGLIRFALPLAPDVAVDFQWLLLGLGSVAVVYGSLIALVQGNLRTTLAYLGISHVGLVLLGLATFQTAGVQGAVLELVNFPLVAGGLFLITAALRQRVGTTALLSLGGAAKTLPWLATSFLLLGLASLGIPGTSGFPAEFLILLTTLETHTGSGIAALFGVVVGAACLLSVYRRSFFGPIHNPAFHEVDDLRPRERAIALLFVVIVLVVGIYPAVVLDVISTTAALWSQRMGG